ncbi:hypothetical protein ANO14919_115620 [Xylariales sp. No.14919]|nr:hypothetical protein F5X98DRAFT_325593 [Xylaria grammica]GAW22027.1 hypothetical protein ANO14919_115620 [Xylariales sp. No.14919]
MSEDTHYFITPPTPGPNKDYSNNIVYEIGQVVTLSWAKDFSSGTLTLTQDNWSGNLTGGPSRNIIENADISEYDWVVSYMGFDPNIQNVFYLGFSGGGRAFGSHYFNITGDEKSISVATPLPTVTSILVSTVTTTLSVSRSTPPSTTLAFVLPTNTGSTSATSLSTGGIAGVAVGVTLGTIVVAGVLGCFGWKLRKGRVTPENPVYDISQRSY